MSVFEKPLSNSSGNNCVILKGMQYRTIVLNFYFSKEQIGPDLYKCITFTTPTLLNASPAMTTYLSNQYIYSQKLQHWMCLL